MGHVTRIGARLKIQDGSGRHLEIWIIAHNSVGIACSRMKFGK